MYSPGDKIIYGGEGVCTVDSIGPAPIAQLPGGRLYYTLIPVYRTGVIYAPTDVSVRMRPVLTREEAIELILSIPGMDDASYQKPADAKKAAEEYRAILGTYESADLLRLIRLIYRKTQDAAAAGKRSGQTDARFFKQASELLYGELAIALSIPVSEVEPTIKAMVDGLERAE